MSEQALNQTFNALRIFITEADQIKALPAWKQKNAKAVALQRIDNLQDEMTEMKRIRDKYAGVERFEQGLEAIRHTI